MFSMKIVGWPAFVNQKVIDSTDITIGEGGVEEDNAENSVVSDRNLTSLAVPDTFQVVMDFDWLKKYDDEGNRLKPSDPNFKQGLSEFDRFVKWYKYIHLRGTHPFEFPSITRFHVTGSVDTALYKITSSLKPQKSGFSMRITMTWKEVYSGAIQIETVDPKVDHVERLTSDYIVAAFTKIPNEIPLVDDYCVVAKTKNEESYTVYSVEKVQTSGKNIKFTYGPLPTPDTGYYDYIVGIGPTEYVEDGTYLEKFIFATEYVRVKA